jgi:4-amino-4-deoxy-L-arabinose transferase-like glycosyltransferase
MQKKWAIGLIFCLLIAGFFSTYKLSESPRTWFDEGIFLQIARNVPLSHGYTLRISPTELVPAGVLSTIGFPLVGPLSASFSLFGIGLLQARIVMVAYILLMVSMAFFFTKRAWDSRHAVWATLLIATHAPVYGNGKNVLGEVPGLFYFFLFVFLLTKLERETKPKTTLWIATGLAAGLFIATKSSFILLVPVLGLALLLLRKRFTFRWPDLALAIGALVLPIALNMVIQFGFSSDIFTSFASYGSLPGLQKITGLTLFGLVHKNLLSFFQQATPAYLLVTLLTWFTAVCVRWKRKSPLPLHEYVSLGFVLLSVAYFLKMPGVFR